MRHSRNWLFGLGVLFVLSLGARAAEQLLPQLKVSENRRFLVRADGTPFFWQGDTAWELFHRLNYTEAFRYLDQRTAQGFNVIQAVAIAELDGHTTPNAYGHLPFIDLDPTRPEVREGDDNDYWDHVETVVQLANELKMYVGLLPTWGRYWHDVEGGKKPMFTPENAEIYGEWLGKRFKSYAIIWILGGDRSVDTEEQKEIVRAMARGLTKGDGGQHLKTFHPNGGQGSSNWFQDDDWLDFHMRQNGHGAEFYGKYSNTKVDYDRKPTKPVLDGEPLYEGHPLSFDANRLGHSTAADIRRPLYWDLFSGAFGHTYGHHSCWQMWTGDRTPINNPLKSWELALKDPGASQVGHARRLLESRPVLTRLPDDSVIVTDRVATSIPGSGRYRFVATRDSNGGYAMVYAPISRAFKVRMNVIKGSKVDAWWYNPRTGKPTAIGRFGNEGEHEFQPPEPGENSDWVLVLDDSARNFLPPGVLK